MKPHDWRAVPYNEANQKNLFHGQYPYTWQCRDCNRYILTNTESDPDLSQPIKFIPVSSAIYIDCDLEIVHQVVET